MSAETISLAEFIEAISVLGPHILEMETELAEVKRNLVECLAINKTLDSACMQRDEANARCAELVKACNGFKWLSLNIENYGTEEWRAFFLAAAKDADESLEASK